MYALMSTLVLFAYVVEIQCWGFAFFSQACDSVSRHCNKFSLNVMYFPPPSFTVGCHSRLIAQFSVSVFQWDASFSLMFGCVELNNEKILQQMDTLSKDCSVFSVCK